MNRTILSGLLCLAALWGCDDKVDYLKEFTNGEEIRYAGKVNGLVYRAGENRLALQFVLGSDPDVDRAVVYWNLKNDSAAISIDRASLRNDTVVYMLENMPENLYSFELYTYDASGNKSVPVYLSGKTYGEKFRSSLYHREIDTEAGVNGFSVMQGNDLKLAFTDSLLTSVAVKVEYTDTSGRLRTAYVRNEEMYAVLKAVKRSTELTFTTCHLPEPDAVDTFALEPRRITVPSADELVPPFESVPGPYAGAFVDGFDTPVYDASRWANLWDGYWGKTYAGGNPEWDYTWAAEANWADFSTNADASYAGATWITVDMTRYGMLHRFWLQSYWPFWSVCPKEFELWAFTGEGKPTAADGWNHWVKIAAYDASVYATDAQKSEAFGRGFEMTFAYGEAPVARYFRIKNRKNYNYDESKAPDRQNNAYNFGLSEIAFSVYSDQ